MRDAAFITFTLVAFSALTGCTDRQSELIFKHDNVVVTSGEETTVNIAGNEYRSPVVSEFPHVLRVHHTPQTYIYLDYKSNILRLVYHQGAIRQGISREIQIAKGDHNYDEVEKLIQIFKGFRDPVVEDVSYKGGKWDEPLWHRLIITEAMAHRPGGDDKAHTAYLDINFSKYTLKTLQPALNNESQNAPDTKRRLAREYYERYANETVEMDVFETTGVNSYDIKRDLMRRLEFRLSAYHTSSTFQLGDTTSTLIKSGTPTEYHALTKMGHLKLKHPASLYGDRVIAMHGFQNKYVFYAETSPTPDGMAIVMKNIRSGKLLRINGEKNMDKKTLDSLFRLATEVCQMHGPLVTVIEANEDTGDFIVTWEGATLDAFGSANTQGIQKYILHLHFAKNTMQIEKY